MPTQPAFYSKFREHLGKSVVISQADFGQAMRYFSSKRLKRREYLIRPLQVCRHESYIVSGLFQSAITDEAGKLHTLYFPHEDWWVGDFKSFKTGEGSCMEIRALEDSVLLQISWESLQELYEALPVFERFFRILNENAGIALQDRIVQSLSQNAEKKYEEFIKRYPALPSRLSQKQIASFLGVTPEYLSWMFNK
jgi:CRP-like cAMP-binding protein